MQFRSLFFLLYKIHNNRGFFLCSFMLSAICVHHRVRCNNIKRWTLNALVISLFDVGQKANSQFEQNIPSQGHTVCVLEACELWTVYYQDIRLFLNWSSLLSYICFLLFDSGNWNMEAFWHVRPIVYTSPEIIVLNPVNSNLLPHR